MNKRDLVIEHVEPLSRACPDCGAAIGQRCTSTIAPGMVHIRRCFSDRSNASFEAVYKFDYEDAWNRFAASMREAHGDRYRGWTSLSQEEQKAFREWLDEVISKLCQVPRG